MPRLRLIGLCGTLSLTLLLHACGGGGGAGDLDGGGPDGSGTADAASDGPAAPPEPVTRDSFSPFGQAAIDAMMAQGAERHESWNFSGDTVLDPGWVLQTPPRATWGAAGAELALPASCAPGSAGCDADFLLLECASQADCVTGGICRPVLATVKAPGEAAKSLCAGHSDEIYDEIYGVLVQAERFADVASLSPFTGRFEAAIRNALTFLSNTDRQVSVRVLFGIIAGTDLQVQTDTILSSITRDVSAMGGLRRVSVGAYRKGLLSWNHSKIVAVDGRLLIQGGQNLWHDHYLSHSPVHDISMRMRGEVAADAHRFLNIPWRYVCDPHIYPSLRKLDTYPAGAAECPPEYHVPWQGELLTGLPVVSLGRYGDLGENPSDAAIAAVLGQAERVIRLSLQDLGPFKIAGITFADWPADIIQELSLAILRGVDVYLVLNTNDARPGGLGRTAAYGTGWETADSATALVDWIEANPSLLPAGASARDLVCERLHLTTLRFAPGEDTWPDGANIANHAKLFIVDDAAFFMGSQNLYKSDLAEFSVLVDDVTATEDILREYWAPLWEQSARSAISGEGVCAF